MRKNIKNYRSDAKLKTTILRIQQILIRAGARRVLFDYASNGDPEAVAFFIRTAKGEISIKLPARVPRVAQVMYGTQKLTNAQLAQAKRTAWKNLQDWIDAQMALIETEMVKLEEVFLPYIVNQQGMTLFELMENKGFLLPDSTQ